MISQPEFVLSNEAIAAGIDGMLSISVKVAKDGSVSAVGIHGDPAWPCGSPEPTAQIEKVKEAVRQQLLATKFAPPMKKGKPVDVELSLHFAIGETYKQAIKEEEAKMSKDSSVRIVDAGVVNGRAIRLVKPDYRGINGLVLVAALIDEQGRVSHAGAISGHPYLREGSRNAACESKFSPTFVKGKPVKVRGIISYVYRRG